MTAKAKGTLRVAGPLPRLRVNDDAKHFLESTAAHVQYEAHRSPEAPADTQTYHLMVDDEVAGFISWRVGVEDYPGERVHFVSVEYVFLKKVYRARKLSSVLLRPLVQEALARVAFAISLRKFRRVYVHSTSSTISCGGAHVLGALERRLSKVVRGFPGVELIGQRLDYPPGATMRLWASSKPRTDARASR